MERRTFLKGAVVASATPAAAWAPPRADELTAMLQEYEVATRLDKEAWIIAGDLEEAAVMMGRTLSRVQISSMWDGTTANGVNVAKPIYAYSVSEIRTHCESNHDVQMLFVSNDAGRARVRAETEKRMNAKIAQLESMERESRRIEDACGFTAAIERAKACSKAVRSIEAAILAFVPATLDEAALKARWIIAELDIGRGYLNDLEWSDLLLDILTPIARAVA